MGAEASARGVDVAAIARERATVSVARSGGGHARAAAICSANAAGSCRPNWPCTGAGTNRRLVWSFARLPGTNAPPARAPLRRQVRRRAADDCLSPDGATRERHLARRASSPLCPGRGHQTNTQASTAALKTARLAALSALGLPHCARSATLRPDPRTSRTVRSHALRNIAGRLRRSRWHHNNESP